MSEKCPHLGTNILLPQQVIDRVHTFVFSITKFNDLDYEWLHRPPQSLNLNHTDHLLVPNLKIWHGGMRWGINDDIIAQTTNIRVNFVDSKNIEKI